MPNYAVKNYNTGEEKEFSMTLAQYEQWKADNPEWEKNWQVGTFAAVSEVGDYQNKLPQGFKDRLNNVKKHHPYAKFDKIQYACKKQEAAHNGRSDHKTNETQTYRKRTSIRY